MMKAFEVRTRGRSPNQHPALSADSRNQRRSKSYAAQHSAGNPAREGAK